MDKIPNDMSLVEEGEHHLPDSELDQVTGGIIIHGAESRGCSNNLTTAIPTDQFRAILRSQGC
jgi:hypothetical protein